MSAGDQYTKKVLITHPEFDEDAIAILRPICEIIMCKSLPPSRDEIMQKISGVDGVFWTKNVKLDKEVLDRAGSQLKVVAIMTSGTDYVDVDELKKRKILLGNARNAVDNGVADLAIGLMIAAARRFHEARLVIEQDLWTNYYIKWLWGRHITDSIIGFFGFGGIAKTIVKRLTGFDVNEVIYNTRRPVSNEIEMKLNAKHVSFDELLEKSDFLFIAAPITPETTEIFNARAFKKMKKTAVLINIARGKIIKQEDLIHALKTNEIFAAALDVMTPEPLPTDHPLLSLRNCILTPHMGTATERDKKEMAELTARNIYCGLLDEPLMTPAYQLNLK